MRLSLPAFVLLAMLFPRAGAVLNAQTIQWEQLPGPYGGEVYSFAVTGSNVACAGVVGGIYRSTDPTQRWRYAGLLAATVFAQTVTDSGVIIAGTQSGLYRSTDDGATWRPTGPPFLPIVFSLAHHPNTGRVFAGMQGGIVYRSTDNGWSWTLVHDAVKFATDVLALATTPPAPTTVYAGTYGSGVWKSEDDGITWTLTSGGMQSPGVTCLAWDAAAMTLYAGTNGEVYRLASGASSWEELNLPAFTTVRALMIPLSPVVYAGTEAGIFRSLNGGGTWSAAANGPSNSRVFSLASLGAGGYLAGTDRSGVYYSPDGENWSLTGVPSPTVFALEWDMAGSRLLAGTNDSLFLTTDRGDTWDQWNDGLSARNVKAIALRAGGAGYYIATNQGVYRSSGTQSWQRIGAGTLPDNVDALVIDPAGRLFAGAWNGISVSSDDGSTWTRSNAGLADSTIVALATGSAGSVFASTQNEGVFRSTDGGSTWESVNNGWNKPQLYTLRSDRATGALYAGSTSDGVFRTTDDGATWSQCNAGLPPVSPLGVLSVFPNGSGEVFLGTSDNGVFRSTDGGLSWTAASAGIPVELPVRCFAADYSGIVYAGTAGGGVYRASPASTDASSIRPAPSGIGTVNVQPHPVRWRTRISFDMPSPGTADVTITDVRGRTVFEQSIDAPNPGHCGFDWRPDRIAPGLYICRVSSGTEIRCRSFIVARP